MAFCFVSITVAVLSFHAALRGDYPSTSCCFKVAKSIIVEYLCYKFLLPCFHNPAIFVLILVLAKQWWHCSADYFYMYDFLLTNVFRGSLYWFSDKKIAPPKYKNWATNKYSLWQYFNLQLFLPKFRSIALQYTLQLFSVQNFTVASFHSDNVSVFSNNADGMVKNAYDSSSRRFLF